MKPSKQQPTKKDKEWPKKIEARTKTEGVKLDNPKGKEQFEKVIRRSLNKKS